MRVERWCDYGFNIVLEAGEEIRISWNDIDEPCHEGRVIAQTIEVKEMIT